MNNGFGAMNPNESSREPLVTPPNENASATQEPRPHVHPHTPPHYETSQPHGGQADYRPSYGQTPLGNGYMPPVYSQPEGQTPYRTPYPQSGTYSGEAGYFPLGGAPASTYMNGPGYSAPQPTPMYRPPRKEKKPASKGFVVGMLAIGMVFSLLLGGVGGFALRGGWTGDMTHHSLGGSVVIQQGNQEDRPSVTTKGTAAYVASVAVDSVVEVSTETVSSNNYFGQQVTQSAGSGVIISSGDGGSYIVTCAHVIEGATKVIIKLTDGTEYVASDVASDSQTDIGIVKIDVKGLKAVSVADFSKVVVGEEVVAIGNPLGELGGSVTNGIVSALDRDIVIDGTTYHLLQTNAEINPGNSGGGLFNMDGELIGIVNAKSAGENVEGLGFAIPINDAMEIVSELIENGYVTGRVQLGFSLIDIQSEADAQYWWKYSRYFTDYGIYIIESKDSQFQTGDRLIAIDSKELSNTSALKNLLLEYEVGDTVKVTISRLNRKTNRPEIMDFMLTLTEKKA